MELNEIRAKKVSELGALKDSLRRELSVLRLKRMAGALTDTTAIRKLRKDVARVLTVEREQKKG